MRLMTYKVTVTDSPTGENGERIDKVYLEGTPWKKVIDKWNRLGRLNAKENPIHYHYEMLNVRIAKYHNMDTKIRTISSIHDA